MGLFLRMQTANASASMARQRNELENIMRNVRFWTFCFFFLIRIFYHQCCSFSSLLMLWMYRFDQRCILDFVGWSSPPHISFLRVTVFVSLLSSAFFFLVYACIFGYCGYHAVFIHSCPMSHSPNRAVSMASPPHTDARTVPYPHTHTHTTLTPTMNHISLADHGHGT